jgi:hypothetical protein
VSPEQFEREKMYSALMAIADGMRKTGVISQEDCDNLDGFFREKYSPLRVYSLDFRASDRVESRSTGGGSHGDHTQTGAANPIAAETETHCRVLPRVIRQEMSQITYIPATLQSLNSQPINSTAKKRVASYARVSTDREEQEKSFEAQVDHYTKYIQSNSYL